MTLTEDQIKKIVLKKHEDYEKNVAYEQDLNMIVNGHDYIKYLNDLSQLENKTQEKLRKKYSKSTKGLAGNIIRPFGNIFTAVGGTKSYIFEGSATNKGQGQKKFIEKLQESPLNGTTDFFMSEVWGKRVIDSPRSTILMEKSLDGQFVYPVFISAKYIVNWEFRGHFDYEYIVFDEKRFEKDKKTINVFRVIDDSFDYTVLLAENKQITILAPGEFVELKESGEDEFHTFRTISNTFGKVPCIQLTSKLDFDMENKISLLDPAVEFFKEYLLDDSIKRIFKFLHGYPIYSEYDVHQCLYCHGSGRTNIGETCNHCNGTGKRKKDVSDAITIELPETAEDHLIKPSDFAAYIAPSIETWEKMNEDLNACEQKIMFTTWGSVIYEEKNSQYSTLGGRMLDLKPVNDVLSQYSNIGQTVDKKINDYMGRFYFPSDFVESLILYGNFYLTHTPDMLLDKYNSLKTANAGYEELDRILEDYYQTIFAKNPNALLVALRDIKFEPYRHNTILEVEAFAVSEQIKNRKRYYQLFRKSINETDFIKIDDINVFNKQLDAYIKKENKEVITNQ